MQAIPLNDLPNFFFPFKFLVNEIFNSIYRPSFSVQLDTLDGLLLFFFLFLYISHHHGIHLNWYSLIKWENLLVFQSISVANDVYAGTEEDSRSEKRERAHGKVVLASKDIPKCETRQKNFNRQKKKRIERSKREQDFLSMHIIATLCARGEKAEAAHWKSIEHVLAFKNVWTHVSRAMNGVFVRIYLCNSILLWESFSWPKPGTPEKYTHTHTHFKCMAFSDSLRLHRLGFPFHSLCAKLSEQEMFDSGHIVLMCVKDGVLMCESVWCQYHMLML